MEQSASTLLTSLIYAWSAVTAVLVVLVIYRGTLSSREDDQIFINDSERHLYQEQQAIIAKMSRLKGPIIGLALASGALLLASAGIWIFEGLGSF
jgi:hypothetical protein